jgi:hypothetical protein
MSTQKREAGALGRPAFRPSISVDWGGFFAGEMTMRSTPQRWIASAAAACLMVLGGGMAVAQQTQRFEEKTAERLAELQIGSAEISSIRYVLTRNINDRPGPDILGAQAYIRLTRCTGYLVVQMNRAAYIQQTYTTGDCEVAGVSAY